jgi:single-strand DNA-binding protein
MASFNKVIVMGNLTRDPELASTQQGKSVAKFDLAINESYTTGQGEKKESVLFMPIVVWGKQGENCKTYLHKGSPCLVEGRLTEDKWEKDGVKHSKVKVVAQRVVFTGAKQGANASSSPSDEPNSSDIPPGQDEGQDVPF